MIELQNVSRYFGEFCAVDDISFRVEPGEVLGFLGPNGAGKSTTMKMITGFLAASSGRISICGHDIESDALAAKRCIGYLPEGAPAYAEMTPLQYLEFIAEIRELSGSRKADALAEAIARLELQDVLYQPIDTLSKGFKRRLGLAQAILHDPKVLILDEPTDGLDPNQKHQVRELIRGLSRDRLVIVSTHILEEVSAVCSRAIIIARGRLIADGTPDQLAARSRYHQAVRLRLGEGAHDLGRLAALTGVAGVERDGEDLLVLARTGQTIDTTVRRFLDEQAWPIRSLGVERGHLDDVFRQLTAGV